MKVFKHKVTSRIGETQFSEDAEVLVKNALASGLKAEEISIVDMTREEYEKAIYTQNFNDMNYQQKRAKEYPPMSDYLDAIVKGDQAQMQKYIDDCLVVKAKYPKSGAQG